jgi:hypothetical protein
MNPLALKYFLEYGNQRGPMSFKACLLLSTVNLQKKIPVWCQIEKYLMWRAMKYLYKKRPLNIIFKRLNKLTSLYILLKVVASMWVRQSVSCWSFRQRPVVRNCFFREKKKKSYFICGAAFSHRPSHSFNEHLSPSRGKNFLSVSLGLTYFLSELLN